MKYSYHMTDEEVFRKVRQSVEPVIVQRKSAGIPVFYYDSETSRKTVMGQELILAQSEKIS